MKHYNIVLLDWDGCLAKTLDIWLDTYKQTFAEYNLYPEDGVIIQQVFGDWNGPSKVGVTNIDEYTQKLLARVNEKYPSVQLYDNVFNVIESLRNKGKKLALITTSKKSTIQEALENNKLADSFDVILTAEDVVKHKPDPEIVNKAVEMLGGSKDEAIIVGDSKSDLDAAQNASIDSILFYPKHNEIFYDLSVLKSYKPTYTVDDFKQILDIVV
jgi:pyrophosphatase PpaX